MFRVSRTRRGDDRTLDRRIALFAAGAAAGLAGIGLDIDWIVTAGIVLLLLGMILGIIERRRAETRDDVDEQD